jgi:hypothetical protein
MKRREPMHIHKRATRWARNRYHRDHDIVKPLAEAWEAGYKAGRAAMRADAMRQLHMAERKPPKRYDSDGVIVKTSRVDMIG